MSLELPPMNTVGSPHILATESVTKALASAAEPESVGKSTLQSLPGSDGFLMALPSSSKVPSMMPATAMSKERSAARALKSARNNSDLQKVDFMGQIIGQGESSRYEGCYCRTPR